MKTRADSVLAIASRFGFDNSAVYNEMGCAFSGSIHEIAQRWYAATGTDLNAGAIDAGRASGNGNIFTLHSTPSSSRIASRSRP